VGITAEEAEKIPGRYFDEKARIKREYEKEQELRQAQKAKKQDE
jgi:hypothetical protein